MRINPEADLSAYDIVNRFTEKEIADIIYLYGEERLSREIAKTIINNRPIETSLELAKLIKSIYARRFKGTFKVNPATKSFQAIRIYVNRELEVLENILKDLPEILSNGARATILSFHSLEDRIVKNAFKEKNDKFNYNKINKKPITASEAELEINPRSRSAKLRVAELVSNDEKI